MRAVGAAAPGSYGDLVRRLRLARGLSGNAAAGASGLYPVQLARTEEGSRRPDGPDEVAALARALGLGRGDHDRLLRAAGFGPLALVELGPDDPTLGALADALVNPALPLAVRQQLRVAVEAAASGMATLAEHAGAAAGRNGGGVAM